MKLAEALRLRKDYMTRVNQLASRTVDNCKVQEGDEPAENPGDLFEQYMELSAELTVLICNINLTNSTIKFVYDETSTAKTMTEALAYRDQMKREVEFCRRIVSSGTNKVNMYSRSEIRMVSTVSVKTYQEKVDKLSQSLRILDTKIQEQNWIEDLVEDTQQ